MRKFVKPAHPGALIPDPERGGFLPQDGTNVNWEHHWIRHAKQGNVIVSGEVVHPQATGPVVPAAPAPHPAPEVALPDADPPAAETPPATDKAGKASK